MGKIVILDEDTANKIAAGEVVERPASVIKELTENSIDAGSTAITVEIKNGGITFMKVTDNGCGISSDDVEIAFEKHATSKIRNAADLNDIATLGFRGEALASIGAVAKVTVVTKTADEDEGSKVVVEGGAVQERVPIGARNGTSITVENLFFNTPARYKFLKKDYTEAGYIEENIEKLALSHPEISFKFINNGKIVIQTPGNNDLFSTTYSLYGKVAESTIKVDYHENGIKVTGLAGKANTTKSNRNQQQFFINHRTIKNKTISSAVEEAYRTIVPEGKYPFVILNLDINYELVDVNVHPTKQEVRFSDDGMIFRAVYGAIKGAFTGKSLVRDYDRDYNDKESRQYQALEAEQKISNEQVSTAMVDALKQAFVNAKQNEQKNEETQIQADILGKPVTTPVNQDIVEAEYVQIPKMFTDVAGTKPFRFSEEDIREDNKQEEVNYDLPKTESVQQVVLPVEQEIDMRIVGIVFDTYIIVESGNVMYMIDQHAGHERVMYEKLLSEYDSGEILAQRMLIPEVAELTNREMEIVRKNKDYLSKLGLEIEEFGGNAVKISTLPSDCSDATAKELLIEIIDELAEGKHREDNYDKHILYTMACKSAVKAHYKMKDEEVKALIAEMQDLNNPYTCPHGRPTIVKMDINEIERKFKRR